MDGLFGQPDAHVRSVEPVPGRKGLVAVRVGRRVVARLTASESVRLGISPGIAWTSELAGACAFSEAVQRARLKAVRLLGVRARSTHALRERLVLAGFGADIAAAAVESLASAGLVDDGARAREIAEKARESGRASRREIERRLRAEGIEPGTHEGLPREAERQSAMDAARSIVRRFPQGLGADARRRRLIGALTRRGFEEEDALDACRAVLGAWEQDE